MQVLLSNEKIQIEELRYINKRKTYAGICSLIIERVFSGAVSRDHHRDRNTNRMSYADFVTFIIAEEDKKHPTRLVNQFFPVFNRSKPTNKYYRFE